LRTVIGHSGIQPYRFHRQSASHPHNLIIAAERRHGLVNTVAITPTPTGP
jgi:hypothetical protein